MNPARWASLALTVIALLGSLTADAQSCAYAYAGDYSATITCNRDNTEGPCSLSQPVTFTPYSRWSGSPLSCATVDWNFGDGTTLVGAAATAPASHIYATAGIYNATATFRVDSSIYSRVYTASFAISVANGLLRWQSVDVTEGQTASFAVTRSNIAGITSLPWEIRRSDGTIPADVVPSSGTVTLPDGVAVARFDVATVDDSVYRQRQSYVVKAGAATGGFLAPSDIQLSIDDDDGPVLDFSPAAYEVLEHDGFVPVTVKRVGGDVNVPVGVSYSVSGAVGVLGTSGTLSFAAGELSRTFNVVLKNDAIWTGKRVVGMNLNSPTGGARLPAPGYFAFGSITVLEDDPLPTLSVSNVSIAEGNAGMSRGSFVLTASQPIHATVGYNLVAGTAKAGEDFIGDSGYVYFFPDQQSVTVSFFVIGDTVPEPDEFFTIEFAYWDGFSKPQPAVCTILNDDAGVAPSRMRVLAGGTNYAYVDIGGAANAPVVIALTSSDPDSASVPATVTIPAGERKALIPITGVTAHGAAEITVQLLPEFSSTKFIVRVDVDSSAQLAFEPPSIKAITGQHVPLQIHMDPPPPNPIELPLEVLDAKIVKAPATVIIGIDGLGSLEVETLAPGFTVVRAILPDTFGGGAAVLDVQVVAASDTPSLTSLAPATGPTAGGTPFVALGSHLTADCMLSFGGAPAPAVTLGSDGTLSGVTPAHAAGTVDVALVCGTARFTLPRAFTYVSAPPTLTSIAPTFGSTSGGTLVRATGANFQSGCWMFFGDQAARGVAVDSTTSLVATTPPHETPGAVSATVRCGDAGAFLASSFAYSSAAEPAPSILSIAPLVGAPGESVTITGSRFRTGDRIDFDGTAATILRTRPDEQIVRIPELPLGLAAITLTDAEGRVTTTGPIFTVVEPIPPQVAKVTPSAALPGSEIVLEGRGFRAGYSFAIGGLPATIVSLDYARAVVRLPDAVLPGQYPIHVLNAANRVAAVGVPIIVRNGVPRIASVAPGCGTTGGGTALVITGQGFEEGAVVTLNGVTASDVVLVSDTELRATAPPGIDGPATLVVTNPNGDEVRITGAFRYSSPFDPEGCVH